MPQLDLANYSSQIFWFAICFAVLYFYTSRIIIPRIVKISSKRTDLIESETNLSFQLEQKISDLKKNSEEIRSASSTSYQGKIDEANKNAIGLREKSLSDLKQKIAVMTDSSRQEIIEFATHSEQKKEEVVEDFIKSIKQKLFS